MTHTYALMEVSKSTYDEVMTKLVSAGYQHAIHDSNEGPVLDLHGIALSCGPDLGGDVVFDGKKFTLDEAKPLA